MRPFHLLSALMAAAAAAPSPFDDCSSPSPSNITLPSPNTTKPTTKLLISHPGTIYLADYNPLSSASTTPGATPGTFTLTLNHTLPGNPSWLAFRAPDLIYAADESSTTLRLLRLSSPSSPPSTPSLTLLAEQNASAGVVHLAFTRSGTRLVASAYGAGAVDVWDISSSPSSSSTAGGNSTVAGAGLKLLKTIPPDRTAPGPNKQRQGSPHPHQAVLDPTGRFFAVNDLGTDTILVLDSAEDAFAVVGRVAVKPAGCGPRHGVFVRLEGGGKRHEKRKAEEPRGSEGAQATHYILGCELANTIQVFSVRYDNGDNSTAGMRFAHLLTQPATAWRSAPGEVVAVPSATEPGAAEVFVSNRQGPNSTDTIGHFRLRLTSQTGSGSGSNVTVGCGRVAAPAPAAVEMKTVEYISTGGLNPRMFSMSKGGDGTIFVGNLDGPLGLAALGRSEAGGKFAEEPVVAGLKLEVFGGAGKGPQFVMPIS